MGVGPMMRLCTWAMLMTVPALRLCFLSSLGAGLEVAHETRHCERRGRARSCWATGRRRERVQSCMIAGGSLIAK